MKKHTNKIRITIYQQFTPPKLTLEPQAVSWRKKNQLKQLTSHT